MTDEGSNISLWFPLVKHCEHRTVIQWATGTQMIDSFLTFKFLMLSTKGHQGKDKILNHE